jgi:hypothetical protein
MSLPHTDQPCLFSLLLSKHPQTEIPGYSPSNIPHPCPTHFSSVPPPQIQFLKLHQILAYHIRNTPVDEQPGHIGRHLNPSAYFAQFGSGFEDSDAVSGEGDGNGGGETTDAGAGEADMEACLWGR